LYLTCNVYKNGALGNDFDEVFLKNGLAAVTAVDPSLPLLIMYTHKPVEVRQSKTI
jgi:hypothetical protein